MAWKVRDVDEQRLRFVMRASEGLESLSALCREFGISRPTGYLWLQRYRECERIQDLAEKSRRPHQSPNRTAAATEDQIVELRKQRPDWGARKLEKLLARQDVEVPAITIHRILLRHGLVREQDRHRSAVKRFVRETPNELWQMDFKGMPESRGGCAPLAVLDDHSRYLLGLFALNGTGAEDVQRSLVTIFEQAGLPETMLMDHGTPWWNMQAHWGWTWLTVWMMKQGIRLTLSGYRHPQTQGKLERCNGSLEAAMFKRPQPAEQNWQVWLDDFRQEYNYVRPHEALAMDVPAQHWGPSLRPYCPQPKPWDYPVGADVRKVRENGGVRFHMCSYFISRALIGEYVQLQQLDESRVVVLFCCTAVRELDLQSGKSFPINLGQDLRIRREGLCNG